MQYHSTTAALVGAVLAVMSNASPIYQNSTSVALNTPSCSPEYASVARTFMAHAAVSPTSTTTPSSTISVLSGFPTNFGLGPVDFGSRNPEAFTVYNSTSTVGTPTKTGLAATATSSPEFSGFHRTFGHGPVVPGRGFNPYNNSTANYASSMASVSEPIYGNGTANFTSSKTSVSETDNGDSCESAYVWFICDFSMWLKSVFFPSQNKPNEDLKPLQNQTTPEVHADTLQSHFSNESIRFINKSTNKPTEVATEETTNEANNDDEGNSGTDVPLTLAKILKIRLAEPLPTPIIDFRIAKQNIDTEIHRANLEIKYYKEEIIKAEKDIANVRQLTHNQNNMGEDSVGTNLFLHVAQDRKAQGEERLKEAEEGKEKLEKEAEKIIRTAKF